MKFMSTVGKARRVYDLNNIPLVSGSSYIKWHLAHSMHAEHRGRTCKCPISNHKVDYSYSKLITGVRISMDKNNNLTECPLELEVLQEFAVAEKITLGYVKLNLAEYVEESESISREVGSPPRKRSSTGVTPTPADGEALPESRLVEEGVVRRYLMSDSKINSTLKIGILMVQVDGERSFVAPPLKTAPVFGGIAGLVAPEVEDDTSQIPNISKPRDAAEVHDLYRRTLVASWSRQPNELPADECIEDIFSGGNGWGTNKESHDSNNSDEGEAEPAGGTLRPSDFRRYASHQNNGQVRSRSRHSHTKSTSSDRSVSTVTGGAGGSRGHRREGRFNNEDSRDARDDDLGSSMGGSMGSLAPTLGGSSDGGRVDPGMGRAKEVDEFEVREDLVAWNLPGGVEA
ncbi:estrogen-responsive protein Fam102A/B [Metarhizium album ARSEF 1941]|uniref:Estrogen-responsive protein Fam102A/B n=1 Tax=Metarhizium album (strain ARSEF 1941) TaxID=1081103 RepID=A0A0B2WYY4_METAS|nr:estrogen-responsive protein Fam102A/B [Metarhizium album ARSEF 1941]KHN98749.1 estrogen-responsive protein Fam102A/B [Metarhizium album ARSEF 1941]